MHDWVEEANLKGCRLCGSSCVTSGKGSEDQGQGLGEGCTGHRGLRQWIVQKAHAAEMLVCLKLIHTEFST